MTRKDIYREVSDRILARLEAGELPPWTKPWKLSGGYPISLRSGKRYRGVNVLLLLMEGYDDPRWGTYRAIAEAGGQVRKGEKATRIVLWKPVKKNRGTEQEENYMLLRDYDVFNANQADGLPELPVEEVRPFTPIETAEAIVRDYIWIEGNTGGITNREGQVLGPLVKHGFDRAAYSQSGDVVTMPDPEQFTSDEAYYTTYFHELVHSTGHEKRLKRLEPALFGTDPYAREELTAEIGASFLSGVAEFESAGNDQSAAYLAGWIKRIKEEPKLIVQASAQAQKAVDLILGTTFDEEPGPANADSEQLALA